MKTKILGLLAVGLLAGPMAANAALLNFALNDGTNNISFQLDSNPIPGASTVEAVGFNPVAVSVNGTISNYLVGFFDQSFAGGLYIGGSWSGPSLLSQDGPQLFSNTLAAPVFAPGTFSLTDWAFNNATYNSDFRLVISAIPSTVPEPGTLALLGLGLLGLGVSRRKA